MTNPVHLAIIEQIDRLRSKEVSFITAIKRVLKKNKTNFEELFETEDSEEEEESDSKESDDEME